MRKPPAGQRSLTLTTTDIIILDELPAIQGQAGRAQTGVVMHLRSPSVGAQSPGACAGLSA